MPRSDSSRRRRVTKTGVSHPSEETRNPTDGLSPEVVRRAVQGDRDALEILLFESQAIAWRFSRAICGHAEDAEDAMQEALIQTFRHVSRLRQTGAYRPWLYRTVRNACLMSRRRRVDEPSRMLSLEELMPAPDSGPVDLPGGARTPEQVVVNRRLRHRLDDALAKLPVAFRVVVFLREMEGLSTRETASVLGLSEDNVKARLHRARLFLRRELESWGRPGGRAGRTRPRAARQEVRT